MFFKGEVRGVKWRPLLRLIYFKARFKLSMNHLLYNGIIGTWEG
ncbi:hypothetical protein bwei_1827 [Bacillus mycoides]|uniref:Uncharacterized protein n=1 Tax=Bacillus mycoides TaxID=1405 RepID=A0A654BS99_BACMY|nr:hypothetical protein bwei_1827 [Bacillus mycoides]EEL05406.1 hypothetical protein bcere0014_29710 [Bacillus cereus BDRD-ST196]VXC83573.1 conserved hypothetical protein [Bacillus mycoides]